MRTAAVASMGAAFTLLPFGVRVRLSPSVAAGSRKGCRAGTSRKVTIVQRAATFSPCRPHRAEHLNTLSRSSANPVHERCRFTDVSNVKISRVRDAEGEAAIGPPGADRAAFDLFFADHYRELARFAYLLTGDHHAADDVTAEAMAEAWQGWTRVASADRPLAYVRRIVANIAVPAPRDWSASAMAGGCGASDAASSQKTRTRTPRLTCGRRCSGCPRGNEPASCCATTTASANGKLLSPSALLWAPSRAKAHADLKNSPPNCADRVAPGAERGGNRLPTAEGATR